LKVGGGLARRYVQPLFELALARGILDQVAREVAQFDSALRQHPEFRTFLSNPSVNRKAKRDAMSRVFVGASPCTINFLKVVLDKNRPEVLVAANSIFQDLLNEHRGVTTGLIETAIPLDEAALNQIKGQLEKRFQRTLDLKHRHDPTLIGGLRLRLGNRVIDASVKGRLARLRDLMIRG